MCVWQLHTLTHSPPNMVIKLQNHCAKSNLQSEYKHTRTYKYTSRRSYYLYVIYVNVNKYTPNTSVYVSCCPYNKFILIWFCLTFCCFSLSRLVGVSPNKVKEYFMCVSVCVCMFVRLFLTILITWWRKTGKKTKQIPERRKKKTLSARAKHHWNWILFNNLSVHCTAHTKYTLFII